MLSGPPVKLSILMWAHNKEHTIVQAVGEVLGQQYPCGIELIVVDDGSTDATPALVNLIDDPRLIVHRHHENRGRGAALTTGIALASGTHILPFDADLEYSAEDIVKIVEPVLKGRCELVYGTRLSGYNSVYQSYRHALGNRMLTGAVNVLFNSCLSDLLTCLKLIPLGMARQFKLRETGFGLDAELTAILLRTGERPFEVPISYYSSAYSHGRKQWRETVSCLRILWRVRLTRATRLKVPVSQVRIDPLPADTDAFPEVAGQSAGPASSVAGDQRGGATAGASGDGQRGQHGLIP
jgi:glycosyltransferase involved in cell wall biosynthesis